MCSQKLQLDKQRLSENAVSKNSLNLLTWNRNDMKSDEIKIR